jgi:hypothetical protein
MPPFVVSARRSTSSLGPVIRTVRTLGLFLWAALGVPVSFAVYTHLAYRIALNNAALPFPGPAEWRWWFGYFLALTSGIVAIAFIPIPKLWLRISLLFAYVGIMGILLAGISLGVSCFNGDCL